VRQRWLSKRALLLHLTLAIWFPGCLVAGWWQAEVALSGNDLSYLYAVEWPLFAIGGVYAWWLLMHIDASTPGRSPTEQLRAARRAAADATAARRAAVAERRGTVIGDLLVAQREATMAAAVAAPAPAARARTVQPSARAARRARAEEEQLGAYNQQLARLAAQGPHTWRRRR